MTLSPEIIQAIGLVAFAFGAAGFSVKDRVKSVILLSIGAGIWTVHYSLLGGIVTACMTGAIGLRTLLSIRVESVKEKHFLFYGSSIIFITLASLNWQGPASMLPLLAAINASFAFSYLNNLGMRYQLLVSSLLWIINAAIWGAYAHILSESFIVALNLRVIYLLIKAGDKPGKSQAK